MKAFDKEFTITDIKAAVETLFGLSPDAVLALKVSGSARQYYRIFLGSESLVVCRSSNIRENNTFIRLSRYLKAKGLPVPEIYNVSPDKSMYVLQDLGDMDFLSVIQSGDQDKIWRFIPVIVRDLVRFQLLPPREWSRLVEFPPLDAELIDFDLKYAVDNYFSATGTGYDSVALEADFRNLAGKLLRYPRHLWGLMFRDFQSRNIMMAPAPVFIDYQSARSGPGIYDLVSFAWQAKAGFSKDDRKKIIRLYAEEVEKAGLDKSPIESNVFYWALFRIMQTLGAYGLRGLKEGKPHFIQSIPHALSNFREILNEQLVGEFPEMQRMANIL